MISAARLAWLQLRRQKARFATALAGVAFAVILVFMQLGFRDALYRSAVNVHRALLADLVIVANDYNLLPKPTRFAGRRLWQALAARGVASVSPLHIGLARWKHPVTGATRDIFVMGVDPARPALAIRGVQAGLERARYPDVALFDRFSRPEYGPVPALFEREQEVVTEANRHQLAVRGLYELGTSFGIDGSIVTGDENFRRIFPGYPVGAVGLGLVRVEPGADPVAVRDELRAILDRDVRVLTKPEYVEQEVAYWSRATPIGFIFAFGAVMGLVVGVIIVYQILFADIADHLTEYATLKAIGYSNRWISAVVVIEATILAVIGYVPGFVAAWQLFGITRAATKLPMLVEPARAGLVLGLTVVMCWVSGLIALRKLRAADPAEIF